MPHLAVVAEGLTHLLGDKDAIGPFVSLAWVAEARSFWQEAEQLKTACLKMAETRFGSDHPDTATSLNNLAGLYQSMGRYGEAEPLFACALNIRETQLGANHPDTAASLNNLALL